MCTLAFSAAFVKASTGAYIPGGPEGCGYGGLSLTIEARIQRHLG